MSSQMVGNHPASPTMKHARKQSAELNLRRGKRALWMTKGRSLPRSSQHQQVSLAERKSNVTHFETTDRFQRSLHLNDCDQCHSSDSNRCRQLVSQSESRDCDSKENRNNQSRMQYSYLPRHPWFVASGQPGAANLNMLSLNLRYTLLGGAAGVKEIIQMT